MIKKEDLKKIKPFTKIYYISDKLKIVTCTIIWKHHTLSNEYKAADIALKIEENEYVINNMAEASFIYENLFYTKEVAIVKLFERLEKIGKKYRKELEKILYSKTYEGNNEKFNKNRKNG